MAVSEKRKAYLRDWCRRNPEKRFMRYFRARLKAKYGMTPGDYKTILVSQDYRCQLCRITLNIPSPTNRVVRDGNCAVVDHIKGQTGTRGVRGILCNNCNRALGLFKHSSSVMRHAADYIEARQEAPYFIPWREMEELDGNTKAQSA